jgi:tetratricopeptide (TPR) repeat protein
MESGLLASRERAMKPSFKMHATASQNDSTMLDACLRCRGLREPARSTVCEFAARLAIIILAVAATPLAAPPQTACSQNPAVEALLKKGNDAKLPAGMRVSAFQNAIRHCPQDTELYNSLAVLLIQQQDDKDAEQWIQRGLAVQPHDPSLRLDLGALLLSQGKPEQALPQLQHIPPTAKGEFYLGMAYRALRNPKAARQAFAKSFALGNHDPYVLYEMIEQDRALHDRRQGLEDFQTFNQRFPNSAWLHLLLGHAYLARHDNARAEAEYRQAVQLDPKLPLAHYQLGRIAFNRSEYEDALQAFQSEIAVDPTFGEAYLYAGTALRRLGKNNDALSYLEKAVQRDPNSPLTYRELAVAQVQAGQLAAATKTLEDGERRFPAEPAFPAQLARLLQKSGNVQRAAQQAKLAETLSRQGNRQIQDRAQPAKPAAAPPNGSSPIARLAHCVEQDNAACAREALRSIPRAVFVRSPDNLNLEAKALILMHQQQQALAVIQRAIQAAPRRADYLITQGRIYQMMDNQAAAMKSFLQAEKLQPGAALPVYYIGMSFFILGNDNNDNQYYDRAARHFKTALELNPRNDRAQFMLGVVNAVEFKLNEAKADLEAALKMNPNNAYYHLHYGLVLSRVGDLAGGRREMQIAEKLDPSYARTHLHLGELDAQMGNYEEARAELEAALRLEPQLSSAYYTLGNVYHHLGLEEKSQQAFEKFQESKSQPKPAESPVESSMELRKPPPKLQSQ